MKKPIKLLICAICALSGYNSAFAAAELTTEVEAHVGLDAATASVTARVAAKVIAESEAAKSEPASSLNTEH